AGGNGDPQHRLQAYLSVAAVAVERKPDQAAAPLLQAIKLIDPKNTRPWHYVQIVRLAAALAAAHPDLKKPELIDAVPKKVEEAPPSIKSRLEAELVRLHLSGNTQADPGRLKSEADKKASAHPQALEMLARHNARYGSPSDTKKAIDAWEPESLRPVG